mgnify:CR=1 FL=1
MIFAVISFKRSPDSVGADREETFAPRQRLIFVNLSFIIRPAGKRADYLEKACEIILKITVGRDGVRSCEKI